MPNPRIGIIPRTRLKAARRVRDRMKEKLGEEGYAILSICNGGYSVQVRLYEGVQLKENMPSSLEGIPIKTVRIKRVHPPL